MKDDRSEKGFRKLIVWQRAHQLTLMIYKLTEDFPKSEIYGLTSQVRRAAVSVAANIAEGYGYGRKGQTGRFLEIAKGSLSEVEYYLILSLDLKYINSDDYEKGEALRAETGFLLHRLGQSVRQS